MKTVPTSGDVRGGIAAILPIRTWPEVKRMIHERDGEHFSPSRLEQIEKGAWWKLFKAIVEDDELLQLIVDRLGDRVLDVRTKMVHRPGKAETRFMRTSNG